MTVKVTGPDGKDYAFPDGTDKPAAIAYFKKKNITGKPQPGAAQALGLTPPMTQSQAHGLTAPPASAQAPAAEKDITFADEKAPTNARYPKLGADVYRWADRMSRALPGVGMSVGGMVGEGLLSIPMAAAGGVTGNRAELIMNHLIYKGVPQETPGEAAMSMGKDGAIGALTEGVNIPISGALSKMAKPFAASAATVKAAEAGRGIRLTPGEAGNSSLLKMGEALLDHLPGGIGKMEKFRGAQETESKELFENVLNNIAKPPHAASTQSAQEISEDVGKQVQKAVKDAREKSLIATDAKYDEVRQMLGIKKGKWLDAEDWRKAIAETEKPRVVNGQTINKITNTRAREALIAAHKLYNDETARFNQELFTKILKTNRPEIIGGYLERAGLEDLRMLHKVMPPDVQQRAARNVLENIFNRSLDAKGGYIDAGKIAASLKTLGEGRGRLIFGSQFREITEASALLNKINAHGSAGIVGRSHISKMMFSAGAALAGLIYLAPTAAAYSIVGEVGVSRLLAEGITNPKFAAGALKILRTAAVLAVRGAPIAANEAFTEGPGNYQGAAMDLPDYTKLQPAKAEAAQ